MEVRLFSRSRTAAPIQHAHLGEGLPEGMVHCLVLSSGITLSGAHYEVVSLGDSLYSRRGTRGSSLQGIGAPLRRTEACYPVWGIPQASGTWPVAMFPGVVDHLNVRWR